MKKAILLIGLIFMFGCYEYAPPGVIAQQTSESYLDSLYRPDTVKDKIGIGYISLKKYLTPSTQQEFQQDTAYNHLSKIEWNDFTKRTNDILAKGVGRDKGSLTVESYRVNGTKYITAFFVDSTNHKVIATIPMK